jgi:peptide/nickel transport system permease protein
MFSYTMRRVFYLIPTFLLVATISFLLLESIPGDLATTMLGQDATAERLAKLRFQLGLDRPVLVRYLDYMYGIFKGDLGYSFAKSKFVADILRQRFPITLLLAAVSFFISVFIGIPSGLIAAIKHKSWWDRVLMVVATGGMSIPTFWLGLNLIVVFAVFLGWLPSGGYTPLTEGVLENLKHIILPACTLSFVGAAEIARMTRTKTLEVMTEDYIQTARAKGLAHIVIVCKHVLKNTMVMLITVLGIRFGVLLGGAVVTEQVFRLPGVGRLIVQALQHRDYVVVQGVMLLIATSYMIINLLVDLTYAFLDPRIRYD